MIEFLLCIGQVLYIGHGMEGHSIRQAIDLR
jgi:hypothetical protein